MKETLKQYQNRKLKEYKLTNYWGKALTIKKEIRDNMVNVKLEKFKNEWYTLVIEHGKNNSLDNKVIYSFEKEYNRTHLLHVFRANDIALKNWIPTDAL